MNNVPELSEELRSIVEVEFARGNSIVRIDRPAGRSLSAGRHICQPTRHWRVQK